MKHLKIIMLQDGLQGNEFNQNAFAKDYKTGRLLIWWTKWL